MPRILIVDDEENMLKTLSILISENTDYYVETARSGREAIEKYSIDTEVALVDLAMPDMNGIEVLKSIKELNENTQVIIMTAYSSVKSAIEAMKMGAFDYITKPFDTDELLSLIHRAVEMSRLKKENIILKSQLQEEIPAIIGRSEAIKDVMYLINKAAETDSNVLIYGESGTGKELVAKAIHLKSNRASGPFVPVNCSAFPETLLEAEFFGYMKGAFSGAYTDKPGKFELASGGTLFLDEIGDMPFSLQSKLLRVIEEKKIQRLGDVKPRSVDVRIVSATNKNLEELIEKGQFREDLFFRLKVITITIPPLRDRREDIPLLIDHYFKLFKQKYNKPEKRLSEEAYATLISYDYPGNVRELEHILENAILTSREDVIRVSDLSLSSRGTGVITEEDIPVEGGFYKLQEWYRSMEKRLIEAAVRKYRHLPNAEIAKILGTTRRILELRMKEYGIKKDSSLED